MYDVYQNHLKRLTEVDFPGGPVAKNPPVDAADTGSIRSGKIPHALGQPRPRAQALEPVLCNKRRHHKEKLAHRKEEKLPTRCN